MRAAWSAPAPRQQRSFDFYQESLKYLNKLIFGSDNTAAEAVNPNTAMRVATVYTCVRIKGDTLGMLPGNIMQRVGNTTQVAFNHPAYYLLHTRPNPWQSSFEFWKWVVGTVELEGEAFGMITRDGGMNPLRITPFHPDDVVVMEDTDQNPYYYIKKNMQRVPEYNVLHFKNYQPSAKRGISTIQQNAETIGSAIKQRKYANRSMGTVPPAYATTDQNLPVAKPQQEQFREYLENQMSGWYESGELPFFFSGFEVKPLGIKPVDAAYLDQISATKEDIFGIFGVPPAIANSFKSGVTFNNLELQNLQFLIYGMQPLITRIEQEVNYKMFIGSERNSHYFKFNEKALLRTDSKTQAELVERLLKIGIYSRNEVRELYDLNPVQYGDEYLVEGNNMVPVSRMFAEPAEPETDISIDRMLRARGIKLEEIFNQIKVNGHNGSH
jgi:HK97 family phage portal protein